MNMKNFKYIFLRLNYILHIKNEIKRILKSFLAKSAVTDRQESIMGL